MENYKYIGLELTPNVFAELLVLLFDGKQFKRATAIDEIKKYHEENGGCLSKNEYVSVFKKACQYLSTSGLINVGYGTWRLNYEVQDIEILEEEIADEVVTVQADKVIGQGDESVYVYYYDTYKKYAEICGNDVWQCKVGRTERDPLQRVLSQAGTCYPELPHIALVIKCENSLLVETALHSILKLRKQWIESAPGVEWFLTSPEEVMMLYSAIMEK